jgi:hypothetical protein
MIEIVFREAERGSLQEALGSQEKIICLPLMLDIGSLAGPLDGSDRKKLLAALGGPLPEDWQELRRLKAFAEEGEAVRVWYSSAPYSLCGLYCVCSLLQPYRTEIHTVQLPETVVGKNYIVRYAGWYEIDPQEWFHFLPYELRLTPVQARDFARQWDDLTEDTHPLRALVNGQLIGVPEDFYDFMLEQSLGDEPASEAAVIGSTIGRCRGGIGDRFYAARIDRMIESGRFRVVREDENPYRRLIARTK